MMKPMNQPVIARRSIAVAAAVAIAGSTLVGFGTSAQAEAPAKTALLAHGAVKANPAWTLAFHDDFSGISLDGTHWGKYSGQAGGNGAGHWSRSNILVGNGMLTLRSRKAGRRIISAGVSLHTVAPKYGKWNVRMRMDHAKNIKFAMLLWPRDNHWPPEVDFAENDGASRARVNTWLHYGNKNQQIGKTLGLINTARWHDFGIQWRPGLIQYLVDGRVVASVRKYIPRKRMWMAIQTEGLDRARPSTPPITDLQIYSVTVWRWTG